MRSSLSYLTTVLVIAGCGGDIPQGPTPGRPSFEGQQAHDLVELQVSFGPRIPGTVGHDRQLRWMLARLDSFAPEVIADTFTYVTTYSDSLTLVNVLARYRPEAERRLLLLAHWDTRPRADQAKDPAQQELHVPGANDGGSGTAVLLELARIMSDALPPLGIDLLFVDGEDYGPEAADMFIGARRYADQLSFLSPGERPMYGVLLDMVGDADPSFPIEGYSAQHALPVVQKVWRTAARLGYSNVFPESVGIRLSDDHIPLNEAGLQTVNIIDFTYGGSDNMYWHTPEDLPSHVSATTLEIVGEVITELISSGG